MSASPERPPGSHGNEPSPAPDTPEGAAKPVSSVLFVCGMNAIRSPMAEALVKGIFHRRLYADSAGARAGEPDPFAAAAMAEKGLSLEGHIPKSLEELEDGFYDLVVTLSPEAHHRALEHTSSQSVDVEYWPTMDPSTVAGSREQILEAYRQVRDSLERRIRERFGG